MADDNLSTCYTRRTHKQYLHFQFYKYLLYGITHGELEALKCQEDSMSPLPRTWDLDGESGHK